ncbi:hypothetical protein ACFFNY_19905 [Paenibacillus hodogayensis]|uniref:Family 2 glycosyl transferase n=1 Tax=Paenibacillus hodogayensis TaxID=279208 RepID=A0ABV5VZV2_9BACL
MKKRRSLVWTGMLIVLVVAAGLGAAAFMNSRYGWMTPAVERFEANGIQLKFRTAGDQLERYENGEWKPFLVKGIDLGATVPGHDPGELAVTKEQYTRWFGQIAATGANTIRVYTILPPYFYEALVAFNRKHADTPLYLMQGIWSPEEKLIELKDAYLPEIKEAFEEEIVHAVGAVYGDTTIPPKPGKASGKYKANAGPYVIGWHLGTEWDPVMVTKTNEKHAAVPVAEGTHVTAKPEASPFERWLAGLLDDLATEEQKRNWQHPLAFTNWVTTDPLAHPGEVLYNEDLVSVDPMHVTAGDWLAGYYAAYHVYPYYPDFFRIDQTLNDVTDAEGNPDPYRSYLRKLKAHHAGIPIMVTEFGVPSSLGLAHLGPGGRDQGGHTEQEQGDINVAMYRTIIEEGYAGAALFSWQDEWFKKTWNTMPFELPADRRAMWLNVLTNEQMFGILGMYPSKEEKITINGDASDWKKLKKGKDKFRLETPLPGWKEVWAAHDEGYLYLMGELEQPFDAERQLLRFGFSTQAGGNKHAAELGGIVLDEGLDTLLTIGRDDETEMTIASNYDFQSRLYGTRYGMIPYPEEQQKDDSGVFLPWKLTVGLAMEPPDSKFNMPFEDVLVGKLQRGTNDFSSTQYNSLAGWEAKGTTVEVRIPWMMLGFSDPSSKQVITYEDSGKAFLTKATEGVRILPWISERAEAAGAGAGSAAKQVSLEAIKPYTWDGWNVAQYVERLKPSYERMKEAFNSAP